MQKSKRLLPMLLALLTLFTCLYTPVSAAIGETVTYSYRTAYQGGNKANGDYKVDGFNIDVLTIHGGSYDGRIAYCINRGARYISPDRTVTAEGTGLEDSDYWRSLSDDQKKLLQQLTIFTNRDILKKRSKDRKGNIERRWRFSPVDITSPNGGQNTFCDTSSLRKGGIRIVRYTGGSLADPARNHKRCRSGVPDRKKEVTTAPPQWSRLSL